MLAAFFLFPMHLSLHNAAFLLHVISFLLFLLFNQACLFLSLNSFFSSEHGLTYLNEKEFFH